MKKNVKLLYVFINILLLCVINLLLADAGTITHVYDDLHRLTRVERSDGTITIYNYDDLGNRTSMVITTPGTIDYYCDNDTDGYYDSSVDGTCSAGPNCPPANCQTTQGNDCNDLDDTVYPTATELCDNKDNDCNSGTADGTGETWYGNTTNCGLGVCSSNGQLTCSSGSQFDTCVAGSPTGDDTDCDDLDDDCDGLVDEHYVITTTNCGTGVCTSTGQKECQSGSEVDTCTLGMPTETPEATCDDTLDNDCDSFADLADGDCLSSQIIIQPDPTEGMDVWVTSVYYGGGLDNEYLRIGGWGDYYYSLIRFDLSTLPANITSAIVYLYAYQETNNTSMYLDRVTTSWDETTKWSNRPSYTYMRTIPSPTVDSWYSIDITDIYNGWKDNTWENNGIQLRPTDNWNKFNKFHSSDYLTDPSLRPKLVIEPAVTDYYCDNDTDGYYDSLVDGTCSAGPNCPPANCQTAQGNDCDDLDDTVYPTATELCDNKDNDCNSGTADGSGETWYGNTTNCGLGVCYSNGQLTCPNGSQFDTCTAGSPTGDDTDCDDLDDDCDGLIDEHYVATTTNCGTGVCYSTGLLECQSGSEVDSCAPGTPTETPEATCDDTLDNDCDGYIDTSDSDCGNTTPTLIWKKTGSLCINNTPALGDDGLLYTLAAGSCASSQNGLAAIDPSDGSFKWGPIIPSGCSYLNNDLSIGSNGLVYVTGDWNACGNGRLVAFNSSDGSTAWDHGDCPGSGNTSPHPRQTPALDESLNSLYFGSTYLCSVDMDSGVNNWAVGGGYYIGERGIAIDAVSNVYYGSHNGGGGQSKVMSYDSGGVHRWQKATVSVRGIMAGDMVMFNNNQDSRLMATDNNGTDLWQANSLGDVATDEAGNLYLNSTIGADVVSLDSGGTERWRVPLPGATWAKVDFTDNAGHVYARGNNILYSINTLDGSIAWTFTADADLNVGAVLTPGGRIFLADADGLLYKLATSLEYAASTWPVAKYGNRRHTEKAGDILPLPIVNLDDDGDGIFNDGDNSSISGDNPCTGGNTTNCDDNCVYDSNPDQADMDNDGVGDVCDNCTDVDGDSYAIEGGSCGTVDCDDNNPDIYPGAIEIPGNGIDEDCDPSTYATVSGSGYNSPEPGFQASLSLDIQASSFETGWLNYYYSKLRINLVSTLITGLSVNGNTITITGEGTVNGVAGYTYNITITEGNPDTMEIIIYNSDGTVYFNSGLSPLTSGDFNVITDNTIQYQLTTFVSPINAGSVNPDCSSVCWYESGSLATLTATENSGYDFIDWFGCDLPANNLCTMTMDADKNVTANFQTCPQPVRIDGTTPVYYPSLQEAYVAVADGHTIQIQALYITENLDINKSIILQGGFDCNFSTVIGNTTLNGNITINDGSVTIGNVILQ